MRSDHHASTTWAPLGRTATVTVTGQRFGTNMLSAVNAQGPFHFLAHPGRVDAGVFIAFLNGLLTDINSPVFLVVDGHSIALKKLSFNESSNCTRVDKKMLLAKAIFEGAFLPPSIAIILIK
jgi:hypothetical protein